MARPAVRFAAAWASVVTLLLLGEAASQEASSSANGSSCDGMLLSPQSMGQALTWTLSNANGSIANLPASVPGYALQALQEAGRIGDPLFR